MRSEMRYDYLIVGQGLAGTALALALLRRGVSVLVIDRQDPSAASRVAAGLVTPLAGKGMNPAWRQAEYLPEALEYYRRMERECGEQMYFPHEVLRLFGDEKEKRKFERKLPAIGDWVGDSDPVIDTRFLCADHGGFEMAGGGRLDTMAYLAAARKMIEGAGGYLEADFDEASLVVDEAGVSWRGLEAERLIFCQGFAGLEAGRFSSIQHRSAKGEMLTLRVDGLDQAKILSRNGWMVPVGGDQWRAGASYEWDDLTIEKTKAGRSLVEGKVADLIKCPYEVVSHEVGVRPIIQRSQPVIGLDPECPRIGFFNGLGSKGVITAPSVAEHFAEYLCGKCTLDPELAMDRL